MIDIDRFKKLNDTFGHAVGDHVLRDVAQAIAHAVRDDDVPARFGGEEFAVLLRNPSPEVALEVGERVRRAVGSLDLRKLGVPGVSVSVGVAVAQSPEVPLDVVIDEADRALYRAKRAGRDRVVAASHPPPAPVPSSCPAARTTHFAELGPGGRAGRAADAPTWRRPASRRPPPATRTGTTRTRRPAPVRAPTASRSDLHEIGDILEVKGEVVFDGPTTAADAIARALPRRGNACRRERADPGVGRRRDKIDGS
jgi:diguanylate cyclase (GGDEF)-like protein